MTSTDEDKYARLKKAWAKLCEIIDKAEAEKTAGEAYVKVTLNCGVTSVAVTQTASIK